MPKDSVPAHAPTLRGEPWCSLEPVRAGAPLAVSHAGALAVVGLAVRSGASASSALIPACRRRAGSPCLH